MRVLFSICAALTVASCAAHPPAPEPYYAPRPVTDYSLDQRDDAHCKGMGLKLGSDSYVQCRMFVAQQRQQNDIAIMQAQQAAIAQQQAMDAQRQAVMMGTAATLLSRPQF